MRERESIIKLTAIAAMVVLLLAATVILLAGWLGGHFRTAEDLRVYVVSFGILAPLILVSIQILQVILPVLPGFLGCIAGAALYGAAGGFWINYIGISIGSIAAYWLAKKFGVRLVDRMVSMKKYEGYMEKIRKSRSYTVVLFLSILLPLAPDDFLCYFSGLIRMSSKKFIAIILLGKPWCILFYCIFFAYYL